MGAKILLAVALLLALDATTAHSQGRRRGGGGQAGWSFTEFAHRAELAGYYGYFWSSDYRVDFLVSGPPDRIVSGNLDAKSNGFWGVELDVNVRPGAQVALIYNRSDTQFEFRPSTLGEEVRSVDGAVEYWHIGGLSGIARGNVMPFGGMTLGATRYSTDAGDDSWKFSFMPQIGVKAYPHPRIGLRAQARLPITLLSGGIGLGFGTGGSSVSVGGYGIFQFDVSGGVMILL